MMNVQILEISNATAASVPMAFAANDLSRGLIAVNLERMTTEIMIVANPTIEDDNIRNPRCVMASIGDDDVFMNSHFG